MMQSKWGVFTSLEEEALQFVSGVEKVRYGPHLLCRCFCNIPAVGALDSHWMTGASQSVLLQVQLLNSSLEFQGS